MSGAIDRLRSICARTPTALPITAHDVRELLDAHDEYEHKAGEWEESHNLEKTRADEAEAELKRLQAERGCVIAVMRHLADGMSLDHAYPALAGVPAEITDALRTIISRNDF